MSTPALTTTIVATETVPLTIPILVGQPLLQDLVHSGRAYTMYLKCMLSTPTVTQMEAETSIMVKSRYFPSSGTASDVGGIISASSRKNTVSDSRMEMHRVTCGRCSAQVIHTGETVQYMFLHYYFFLKKNIYYATERSFLTPVLRGASSENLPGTKLTRVTINVVK